MSLSQPDYCYSCKEIVTFCDCKETITSPERWVEVLESRLDTEMKRCGEATRLASEYKADRDALGLKLYELENIEKAHHESIDETDFFADKLKEVEAERNELQRRLGDAEMRVREIVAWLDVIESKYDPALRRMLGGDWPTYWLSEVRATISGCGVERGSLFDSRTCPHGINPAAQPCPQCDPLGNLGRM